MLSLFPIFDICASCVSVHTWMHGQVDTLTWLRQEAAELECRALVQSASQQEEMSYQSTSPRILCSTDLPLARHGFLWMSKMSKDFEGLCRSEVCKGCSSFRARPAS